MYIYNRRFGRFDRFDTSIESIDRFKGLVPSIRSITTTQSIESNRLPHWPSHKDLIKTVNDEAEVLGFGVVIRRSVGKELPAGYYPRYNLVCIKGRLPVTTSTGKRPKQTSRREGCPFDARAYYNSLTMRWTLKVMNSSHSHIMSSYASNIPVHRRRKRTLDILSLIHDLSKMPKSTRTDISDQVALQVAGMVVRPHDVINEQAKKKKVDLGLHTATQQFLHELRTDPEVIFRVHRQGNDSRSSPFPSSCQCL